MKLSQSIAVLSILLAASRTGRSQSTTVWTCSPAAQVAYPGTVSNDGRYLTYVVEDTVTIAPQWGPNYLMLQDTSTPAAPAIVVGGPGNQLWHANSWQPCATPDGRLIVFSDLNSHDPGDFNNLADVYLYDRAAGTYELISADSNGVAGNGPSVTPGAISEDGRYVVFSTVATDIAPGITPGLMGVVVRDRMSGTTTLVSAAMPGLPNNGHSYAGAISTNGRYVSFQSTSSNLVPGDNGMWCDVFLRDLVAGTTTLVSQDSSGGFGNADSGSPPTWSPVPSLIVGVTYLIPAPTAISSDGRFVAFGSRASNLVSNDTNSYWDVFVRDTVAGVTTRVSVGPGDTQVNNHSVGAVISGDGRFVGFFSGASNLAPPPSPPNQTILNDRLWNRNEIVSVGSNGLPQNILASGMALSRNGRFVSFSSPGNLAPPCGYVGNLRVYLHDRGVTLQRSFCPDGSAGAACPCGSALPAYPSESGCTHSLGSAGTLTSTGDASLSADTLVLQGSHMTNSFVLYFQGSLPASAGAGAILGDGVRCVAGQIRRLGTKLNVMGSSSYPVGADSPVSVRGQIAAPGSQYYQGWFRDPAPGFCTSSTFNLTNGREIVWVP